MRLLFFLEPFPVRQRPLDYGWVLEARTRQARELGERGVHVSISGSDALGEAYPELGLVTPGSLGLRPSVPEDPSLGDAAWVGIMEDPAEPVWRPVIEAILEATRPEAIVTWNVNAPLRAAAQARGIVLMHQELGPMRRPHPTFYFCDPLGVNGGSAVPAAWAAVRGRALDAAEEERLGRFLAEELAPATPAAAVALRLGLDPGKRTLAVALQVGRDSNLLAWSRVAGNRGLLETIARSVDPERFQVVVKAHPLDPAGGGEVGDGLIRPCPREVSADALVGASDALLTINSSCGFEALARGKVVYTFGASPYAGLGITRDLSGDPAELRRALERETFRYSPEEETLRRRFLHFMFFRYLVPEAEFWDPDALLSRFARWRTLAAVGAPLLDWFEGESGAARERDIRAERRERTLAAALAGERDARRVREGDLAADLARADRRRVELEGELADSAAERAREQAEWAASLREARIAQDRAESAERSTAKILEGSLAALAAATGEAARTRDELEATRRELEARCRPTSVETRGPLDEGSLADRVLGALGILLSR